MNNLKAMGFSLINSFSFEHKEKKFMKLNWELIEWISLYHFDEIRTIFTLSDTFYEALFSLKQKYERIQADFAYFELHNLIKNTWPILY